MASDTRIPRTEITGPFGFLLKRLSVRMVGQVPDAVHVMWHNRTVLKGMMAMGQKTQKWDQVPADLKSYAHMATAAQIGCSWCLDYGYFEAQNKKLDLAKASQVPRWRVSDVFTPLERDVMEYAEAMTVTPSAVTDELSARLLEALGPAGLIELDCLHRFANLSARSNTALGIESQGFSSACEIPLATPVSA